MAGTGLDRLSVLPSGLANQRQNMHRISIAMSGGPNPAEIIDLVVLAERLGYESAWVAEGMAATGAPPGGLRHADLAHPGVRAMQFFSVIPRSSRANAGWEAKRRHAAAICG
jgi:alkanesulfonate monooxygenase SsuD/methylene tetrahydromethanopterin reductase-like flavin-dependent oxidoreductase (luciferase family)